ncbi:chemotaxis protein CheA [Proteus vulgaris]|jgi:two-component system chemotaxis sensor kinase CheA|uniref:chemotaxis protein CheA n=1 Tax=Proteus TaxID=583 RepID=UPI000C9FB684|nr:MULTISPECIES: chemotaxis protein CheA [Proteus]AYY81269.1 chemotaxis protein CheA [Proteus vulgaris]MBG5983921.1 chemotaxis protein CheA [Proteus vulgaris]MBI6512963.1 chemotaxis protein CheA [Proteus sp. PR00174]MCH4257019.1 chemotaxis protein CheA [Proteus vulgaris]MDM3558653.1 chemotaxis protein CheA [Proteus vulgaris]
MDITEFYQTFFDEADELLADMEQHLLLLDPENPDQEQMNAIFRSAHSIKGGAATFGFVKLQQTTHVLENLLDSARRHEMALTDDIINLFLEAKDIMQQQLDAHKNSQEPDEETFNYICEKLRQLALDVKEEQSAPNVEAVAGPEASVSHVIETETSVPSSDAENVQNDATVEEISKMATDGHYYHHIILSDLKETDIDLMLDELKHLGDVSQVEKQHHGLEAILKTTATEEDISAVLCFVIEPEQISFRQNTATEKRMAQEESKPSIDDTHTESQAEQSAPTQSVVAENAPLSEPAKAPVATVSTPTKRPATAPAPKTESTSIRVAVEKVDQLINLVGELVITQSMLAQHSDSLEPSIYSDLLSCIAQLQRNSRDLQESVMSIRMMPMEYVFSRFPRVVRDLAGKMNKKVELNMIGSSTELDKSLIEKIIDPLTHLVRNSLDHGIEMPADRVAVGKPEAGQLTLSAEHQGGNICIEVTDDGAGLNRERILKKAISSGLSVSENMSNEEVAMLIFAPGFSTAEVVTDVSGRGVGMDVVKRNIQEMGGQIQISFEVGKGTRIRILLPLTLAILDGMSVKVQDEVFILPLGTVVSSLQPEEDDIYPLAGDEKLLQVRGEYLPLIELHRTFNIEGAQTDITQAIAVIVQSAGRRYALLVDKLVGQHQVVVKNIESNYRKVPGISAATIMGDGSVALILDVPELQRLSHTQMTNKKKTTTASAVI